MGTKKRRTLYMHTLNREPAGFYGSRDGVCFSRPQLSEQQMATSLAELREQQRVSQRMRYERGLSDDFEYGYIRVVIDE